MKHTCYACDEEPTAIVWKSLSRGLIPVCGLHLQKLNQMGLVDDSEMPEDYE